MIVEFIPNITQGTTTKAKLHYTGDRTTKFYTDIENGNSVDGRVVVQTLKNYSRPSGDQFDCYGRVLCGVLKVGMNVKVIYNFIYRF